MFFGCPHPWISSTQLIAMSDVFLGIATVHLRPSCTVMCRFSSMADATRAIQQVNGLEIAGAAIKVCSPSLPTARVPARAPAINAHSAFDHITVPSLPASPQVMLQLAGQVSC